MSKTSPRLERWVLEPRRMVRTTLRPFVLIAEAGEEGHAQVNTIKYEMGLRRPRLPPSGFKGLWAFAFSRWEKGKGDRLGVAIFASEDEALAKRAELVSAGWLVYGETWLWAPEDIAVGG